MRKEIIWVGIIGILFGLIIAFGVWRINSSMIKSKPVLPSETPSTQTPGEFIITLNSPENNNVVTTSPLTVSGLTRPLTWTVVSGEAGDYILQSNEKGEFNQNVVLTPGINRIRITAFDSAGSQSVQKVLVVYSSAFVLKNTSPSTTETSASGDAAIRENVAKKVALAMSQPKAYLGVVTDITSSTIQLKNTESQIEQIAIGSQGISVVNIKGTNNKAVKLTDIAIGDFIVAMGYVNASQVLEAQRILISDPLKDLALTISFAKVTSVTKNSFTVVDVKGGETQVLAPGKNTVLSSYANGKVTTIKIAVLNVDDQVIFIKDTSPTPPTLRSVFDI